MSSWDKLKLRSIKQVSCHDLGAGRPRKPATYAGHSRYRSISLYIYHIWDVLEPSRHHSGSPPPPEPCYAWMVVSDCGGSFLHPSLTGGMVVEVHDILCLYHSTSPRSQQPQKGGIFILLQTRKSRLRMVQVLANTPLLASSCAEIPRQISPLPGLLTAVLW